MNNDQIEQLFVLVESNNTNPAVAKALEKLRSHIQDLRHTVDELSVGLEDDTLSDMVNRVLYGV